MLQEIERKVFNTETKNMGTGRHILFRYEMSREIGSRQYKRDDGRGGIIGTKVPFRFPDKSGVEPHTSDS